METLLYAARFVHFAAAMQLFGITAFQAWMAPAGLREHLHARLRRLTVACAWLLLLSALLWLALMAGSMGEGWSDTVNPEVIGTVLTATGFGRVWGMRLLLIGVLLAAVILLRSPRRWWLLDLLAMAALGSLGFVGHAASDTGLMGLLHQSSQVLHLLGSGFWIGCLLPLVFCLRTGRPAPIVADVDESLRRFSGLGHVAVAAAVGTGVVNSWFILRESPLDPGTPYQGMLLAKVILVLLMICVALLNRYLFVPRMPNDGPGVRQLRTGTIAEIVISAGVLGLVSVLGTLAPM